MGRISDFQCQLAGFFLQLYENNLKTIRFVDRPNHLKFDSTKLEGTITNYCDRNDLLLELDELLVIEYYSRR